MVNYYKYWIEVIVNLNIKSFDLILWKEASTILCPLVYRETERGSAWNTTLPLFENNNGEPSWTHYSNTITVDPFNTAWCKSRSPVPHAATNVFISANNQPFHTKSLEAKRQQNQTRFMYNEHNHIDIINSPHVNYNDCGLHGKKNSKKNFYQPPHLNFFSLNCSLSTQDSHSNQCVANLSRVWRQVC